MARIELVKGPAVWAQIKRTLKQSSGPCWVAVAYFGRGAARLLPLRSGSTLVVDASLAAVEAGVTHPKDLLSLQEKGVRICSVPRLHAKAYVFGRTAIVGSANASQNSVESLIETAIVTNHQETVNAARRFVEELAKNEVGPSELKRLQRHYRAPRFVPGGKKRKRRTKTALQIQTDLPRIKVVHLSPMDLTDKDEAAAAAGANAAKKHSEHPRSWKNDYFVWRGSCSMQSQDRMLMISRESDGRRLVDAIATVRHVRRYKSGRGDAAIVFFEHPPRKRRALNKIASDLGRGALKRLRRGGNLSYQLSDRLREYWSSQR